MWYPLALLGGVLILAMLKANGRKIGVVVTQGPGRILHSQNENQDDTEAESEEDQKETDKFIQEALDKETVLNLPVVLPNPSFLTSSKVDAAGNKVESSSPRWTRYVQAVKTGGIGTITPNFNLGFFGLNMRTLEDFGYAKNVKKTTYNGRQVWKGDFINAQKIPSSLDQFLADGPLQYEVFLKMTERHYAYIQKKYDLRVDGKYVGVLYNDQKQIEGQTPTYSGLLAVAKFAGLSGLDKWVKGDRKPATTEMYKKVNGIF
jgi:hypothetical protein